MFDGQMGKEDGADGMDYFLLQPLMKKLLESHGLRTSTHDEWTFGSTGLPAIRAALQSNGRRTSTRLDVELCVAADQLIIESFAGIGEDEEKAAKDAIENFCRSSLHVFLAAFWNRLDSEQVMVERWHINGTSWDAYIGNYIRRAEDGEDVPVPAGAFPLTEALVCKLPLEGDLHWVRTYYCSIRDRQRVAEALLDNEVWAELQKALLRLEWPSTGKFYSVRNFLILRRAPVSP